MLWVLLKPTELFVVLNQGQDYLEGYLATKPSEEYATLEAELELSRRELKHPMAVVKDLLVAVQWDERLTRGIVLSAAGFFADVFLLDYGVRECCSKNKLYELPEKYQQAPGYGIRIELENPLTNNLRDTIVMVTCLRRLNGISARGTEAKAASDAVSQMNANETRVPSNGTLIKTCLGNGGKNGVDKSLIRKHIEPVMNGSTKKLPRPAPADELTNGVKLQEVLIKPPNDLLLEMIGTRCLLTRLLVHRVTSPIELLCSHYPSLIVVRNALDSMNELPMKVPHEEVQPNMLVLVLWKATLHRGIVGAIFTDRESAYRVEFIDLPGYTEAALLYYAPSSIANCAPRALMRVRLNKPVQDIDRGDVVTLLCDTVVDNTAYGDLVRSDNETLNMSPNKSRL